MTSHGAFHWNELNTWNAKEACDFYSKTLGWEYDEMPMPDGTYYICKSGEEQVGGIFQMNEADFKDVPEHWLPYIAVDDIDMRCEKIKTAGGTIIREPMAVPDIGKFAIVSDSNGAVSGWMTPAPGS